MKQSEWRRKAEEEGKTARLAEDLQELAGFTRDESEQAFREDGAQRFHDPG